MIFGATGTGKTTLAAEFAKRTGFTHLDSDDYYWRKTNPPFQEKVPILERNQNIKVDFHRFENVIISGSMISWDESWKKAFNLVVFLTLENSERLTRLKEREVERYGDKLLTDNIVKQTSKEFLIWANQYENLNFNGTTKQTHINWLQEVDGKILELNGADALHQNVQAIINEI